MYAVTNQVGLLLADEMGLGKTLQAIGAAMFLKAYNGAKKALIVTPASLKFNWPLEIEKFTDEKYVVIDGTPEERVAQWLRDDVFFYVVNFELLLEDLFGGRKFKEKKGESEEDRQRRFDRHEKISAKAKQRRGILTEVRNRVWDIMAVDEAQAIKHHSSSRTQNIRDLNAKCRMALTGTPMDGRLEELHSLMQFVAPGLLMSKTRFFQRYVETDFWGKVTGYKRISEVSQRIQPFFLRRLKRDVLKDLPDKVYENRLVSLTPEECKIYKSLAAKGHEATEDELAVVAIIRCKQFCNWPSMVDDTCKTTSKMDAFRDVLDEVVLQNGHKALIFSQYKEMLNIIVVELDKMGIKYLRIDGDTEPIERASMQKQFNEDKTIDVMIGTEAMSAGLNFQSADYVLNYDDNWSPAIMAQREDRAHRQGQRNVVTVVNFVCRDTIEERIRGVIYAKNRITAQVLGDDTDDLVLRRLGPKDMAKLL
jgi:SNF2 family DNA or RNA helicase